MPSFSYTGLTNPYTSTPPSVDTTLKNLTRSRNGPPAPAVVQLLQEQIVKTNVEWSLDLAQGLCSFVLYLWGPLVEHEDTEVPDGSLAVLFLLTTAMEQMEDDVLYSVLVQNSNNSSKSTADCQHHNLLDLMTKLTMRDPPIYLTAMFGLATACRALDRLQHWTSLDPNHPDTAWWMTEADAHYLAPLAVRCLNSGLVGRNSTPRPFSPSSEQIKLAGTSILVTILKHDMTGWLDELENDQLYAFCQQLLAETQYLCAPDIQNSSIRYTLPCAMLSAALLALIQWRHDLDLSDYDRTIHATSLVENLVHFCFPSTQFAGNSQGPRWLSDGQHEDARTYGLDLIYCWYLSGGEASCVFAKLERHWRPFVECFWNDLSADRTQEVEKALPAVFLLHTSSRLATRSMMFSIFQRLIGTCEDDLKKASHRLLTCLFPMFHGSSFSTRILSVGLTCALLSDKKNLSTHDDLSRALWSALDNTMIHGCMTTALEYATTDDSQQPFLLTILDILNLMLEVPQFSDYILGNLGAESLETFIYLIKPREVRIDFMDAGETETQDEFDSNTPPANNLSRMDEKSICIEHEEEKEPRGMDNAVRLAAATALARLGFGSLLSADEGVALLKSRICTAVNDFVVGFHHNDSFAEASFPLSLDISKRSLRLQLTVATSDNEDFVATMLFTAKALQQKKLSQLRDENTKFRQQADAAAKKEKQLQHDKNKYMQQCRSQSIVFQREMSRTKKNIAQDARQLVAIHASERSQAENRVSHHAKRIEVAESELQDARFHAEESQKSVVLTKEELQIALCKVADLQHQNVDLSRQISQEEAKASELAEELHSQSEKLDGLAQTRQELEEEIHERDQIIADIEGANGKLQEDLEDLFADMVSLTQIYQHKENEEASTREINSKAMDDINDKLRQEHDSNKSITGEIEKLRQENDKLYKKLAKYKERLEEERRERQKETNRRKRTGPVSYINQLHQSTASDQGTGSRDRSTRKESGSERSSRDKSRLDKENNRHTSVSSSQRRKYY